MQPGRESLVVARYQRSSDKKIAGVCGGFANMLGWDPFLVRLLWVLLCFASLGTMVLIYLIVWAISDEA